MSFSETTFFDKLLIFMGENYYNVITTFTIFILFYLLRKEYKRESNIMESVDKARSDFDFIIYDGQEKLQNLFEKYKEEINQAINTDINTYLYNLKQQMNDIFDIYKTSIKKHELQRLEMVNKEIIEPAKEISERVRTLSSNVAKAYNAINRVNEQINTVYSEIDDLKGALSRRDKKIRSLKEDISKLKKDKK